MTRATTIGWFAALVAGGALGFVAARWTAEPAPNAAMSRSRSRDDSSDLRESTRELPAPANAGATAPSPLDAAPSRIDVVGELGASDASELESLGERVRELEEEVARLRLVAREGDERRRQLKEIADANPSPHSQLWLEVLELFVEPERITEDPRRALPLLLRIIDETGLAVAPNDDGERRIGGSDPTVEETELLLYLVKEDSRASSDGRDTMVHSEEVHLEATIRLPRAPAGWLGDPLTLAIALRFRRTTLPEFDFTLEVDGLSPFSRDLVVKLSWSPTETSTSREPYRGGREDLYHSRDEFRDLHEALETWFERFKSRVE